MGVEVEHAIEADGALGRHVGADGSEGLQAATGADADEREPPRLRLHLASSEIDVGEGVQLVEYDVDIIRADTVRQGGDALSPVGAGDGVELAVRHVAFPRVEMGGHGVDPRGVAHQHHAIRQLLRP